MATFAETLGAAREQAPEIPRNWRLHAFMLAYCLLLGAVCIAWRRLFDVIHWKQALLTDIVLLPILVLPAIFRHERGQIDKRDAALILPWILLLRDLFIWVAVLSAGLNLPLRDGIYDAIDRSFGLNVADVVIWSAAHSTVRAVLQYSYYSLFSLLLAAAIFLPPLIGRRAAAERFVLGVTISFLASLPIFALFPAVGPWVGRAFLPDAVQQQAELSITALRAGHHPVHAAIICFPSFHVIWCVLSAAALWSFKPLRAPAAVIAVLIAASTITTGWHYACDVLSGLVIAALSLSLSEWLRLKYL